MKKVKFWSVIGIFLISFLCHFLYDWFPNSLFSIFFPVNESIWEHMKIIFSAILIFSPIEYFILKKKNIHFNNFLLSNVMMEISGIIIYLIIFIPLYLMIGENMIISIGLLFIVYGIVEIIGYYFLNLKPIKYQGYIATFIIIIMYIIFSYFTYQPPKNFLFYDIKEEKYGIDIYEK